MYAIRSYYVERALTTLIEVEDNLSSKEDFLIYAQVYQRSGLYAKEDRNNFV